MSAARVVVMFQMTRPLLTGMTKPRGNVQTIPTPMVAAPPHRRWKTSGTVGLVPNVNDPVITEAGSPGSSAWKDDVVPGEAASACGLPSPICCAVAVTELMKEISNTFGRTVAGASH